MYYIIVDKCIVIYSCIFNLCRGILAHTYDHRLMRGEPGCVIHTEVISDGVVSVIGVRPHMKHDAAAHIIVGIIILDDAVFRHVVKIKRHTVHGIFPVAHLIVLEQHPVRAVAPDTASVTGV